MIDRMKKLGALLLIALLYSCNPAMASQNATTLPTSSPYPGLTMLNNINSAFDTFQTNFSGAAAPSSPKTWQLWEDTTNSILKIYNGTAWLPIGNTGSSLWGVINNGAPTTLVNSTGSSNAYVVTYAPAVTALVNGTHYSFIANFANTSTATEKVNAITAHAITKQGSVALASGDIPNGSVVNTVWDGTEFQMISPTGNSANGTVTSVAAGTGLAGGTITSSGTISLGTAANNTIMANLSGTTGVPTATPIATVQAALSIVPTKTYLTSGSGATYTTPTGAKYLDVVMCAGGGGGGASGTGGGGSVPTNGGNTTFGTSLLTANGGGFGAINGNGINGGGGIPSSGTIGAGATGFVWSGSYGGGPIYTSGGINGAAMGGTSPFGGAGGNSGGTISGNGFAAATNSCSGGGGASGGGTFNGAGGASGGYIEARIVSPASTYTYTIGAGGLGEGDGMGGNAGGAGGSGIIIIDAH